jgi:predicted transcriptional regulator
MASERYPEDAGLSSEQIDAIEHFEADYNAVDRFLRRAVASDSLTSFSQLVRKYSARNAGWRDAELLITVADVRNAIVHGKTEPYRYVAVPAPAIIQQLSNCRERLLHPRKAIPTFQREVQRVSVSDALSSVLKVIKKRDYSQFPVYGEKQFRGLLTENGITGWLALHVTTRISLVDLEDVSVNDVLASEEPRKTYEFVRRDSRVDEIRGLFLTHELLEAVLVTASGNKSEAPMGIATRWDVFKAAS